jgi:hypothetical protein
MKGLYSRRPALAVNLSATERFSVGAGQYRWPVPATISPEELLTWRAAVEEGRPPRLVSAQRFLADVENLQADGPRRE